MEETTATIASSLPARLLTKGRDRSGSSPTPTSKKGFGLRKGSTKGLLLPEPKNSQAPYIPEDMTQEAMKERILFLHAKILKLHQENQTMENKIEAIKV